MKFLTRFTQIVFFILCVSFLVTSCKSDDPELENEEEVISKVTLTFANPSDASDMVMYEFRDPSGNFTSGTSSITSTKEVLTPGVTYNVSVKFINDTENPEENITEEVEEESNDHLLIFEATNGLFSSFTYNDTDASGNYPLGLNTMAVPNTDNLSQGILTVILKHEPDKTSAGATIGGAVAEASSTNAGGSTDAAVSFNITVQN